MVVCSASVANFFSKLEAPGAYGLIMAYKTASSGHLTRRRAEMDIPEGSDSVMRSRRRCQIL